MKLNRSDSRSIGKLVTLVSNILEGNFALYVSPATLGSSAEAVNTAIAGDGFTRDVECEVRTSLGDTIYEYNGTLPVAIASTTAGDGTATIPDTEVEFMDGKATVTITYTGTWAEADTCTLTLGSSSSIAGTVVANKTSVDTLIA